MFEFKYFKSEFARNSLTLAIGTSISQIIPILISPVLSRLYSPGDYGLLAVFTGFAGLVASISTLRYEMAIVMPKDDGDSINIACLSSVITAVISILTLAIVFLFNRQICFLLKNNEISSWLFLIPASVFLTGIYQILNYWTIRKKSFKNLSFSKFSMTITGSGTNLFFGFLKFGTAGLIIGGILGQFASTLILFFQSFGSLKDKFAFVSKNGMLRMAKLHKDFPRVNSIHAFTDILRDSLVIFMLSGFFNVQSLGLYAFTLRILKAPAALIGSSVSQVFFQKACDAKNNGENLQLLVRKIIINLCVFSFPFFLLIFIFSPAIFAFAFGNEWKIAGDYARILSPWLFMNFIVSPVSQLPVIVGKQKQVLFFSIVGNSMILISILIGGLIFKDIITGFVILSSGQVVYLTVVMAWIYKISKPANVAI